MVFVSFSEQIFIIINVMLALYFLIKTIFFKSPESTENILLSFALILEILHPVVLPLG